MALLAVVLVFSAKLLDAAAGPDAAIRSALQQAEVAGVVLAIPGASARLVSRRLHYDRITTHEVDYQSVLALSTLDFEGSLDSVQVSSLGLERIEFEREGSEWRQVEGSAPRLTAIVAALEARRQAVESGDLGKLEALAASAGVVRASREHELFRRLASDRPPRYRTSAWYIRLERNRALVTEDYRIEGGDERASAEKGTRRLTLERHGAQFLFSESLL